MEKTGHTMAPVSPENRLAAQAMELIQTIDLGQRAKAHQLASRLGVTRDHLDRILTAETGHTLRQHLDRRIEAVARELLLEPGQTAKSVAYALGFKAVSHFSRWFTSRVLESPSKYRSRYQASGEN